MKVLTTVYGDMILKKPENSHIYMALKEDMRFSFKENYCQPQ